MWHMASRLWMNILACYVNSRWLGGGVGGKQRIEIIRGRGGGGQVEGHGDRWTETDEKVEKRRGRRKKTKKGHSVGRGYFGVACWRLLVWPYGRAKGNKQDFTVHHLIRVQHSALQINTVHLYCRFSRLRRPFVQAPRWAFCLRLNIKKILTPSTTFFFFFLQGLYASFWSQPVFTSLWFYSQCVQV